MKKLIIILITFIFISCGSQKKAIIDYSNYSINDLNTKKTSLELESNYELVNHYLEQIERGDITHMALTKIDNGIVKPYWENESELKKYYYNWKDASSKVSAFENKYAPELIELSNQFRKGEIENEKYYRLNRESRARLRKVYPYEYPKLSDDHVSSLKTMWKQTGRFMLEDYRKKGKLFPTYWIPENDRENSKKTKKYKAINQELLIVENELNKRN
jgi:hypothetical protein